MLQKNTVPLKIHLRKLARILFRQSYKTWKRSHELRNKVVQQSSMSSRRKERKEGNIQIYNDRIFQNY